jgi:hypothetical protein
MFNCFEPNTSTLKRMSIKNITNVGIEISLSGSSLAALKRAMKPSSKRSCLIEETSKIRLQNKTSKQAPDPAMSHNQQMLLKHAKTVS